MSSSNSCKIQWYAQQEDPTHYSVYRSGLIKAVNGIPVAEWFKRGDDNWNRCNGCSSLKHILSHGWKEITDEEAINEFEKEDFIQCL